MNNGGEKLRNADKVARCLCLSSDVSDSLLNVRANLLPESSALLFIYRCKSHVGVVFDVCVLVLVVCVLVARRAPSTYARSARARTTPVTLSQK